MIKNIIVNFVEEKNEKQKKMKVSKILIKSFA